MDGKTGIKTQKSLNPRVMIAAASSGSGKTVITCALLKILKDRGLDPVSFKCGPDYIDPMFHRTVLGIDSHNLDTFLAGEDGVLEVFSEAVSERNETTSDKSKTAVIEGVMGIYDGMSPGSLEGSSYEIARITQTPIILVVNAQGVGRTVISVIKGILADDDSRLIKGIILNRMSDAFFEKIRPVMQDEIAKMRDDVEILGHIPKTEDIGLESRHLGLKLPGEIEDLRERIDKFAAIVDQNCDIEAIIESGRMAEDISSRTRSRSCSAAADARLVKDLTKRRRLHEVFSETLRHAPVTLAVARDEAFCFYYPENLRELEACGMKIVEFSPIHDAKFPDEADALLLGGGYPELYLEELSRNTSMLGSVRNAIENGMPSIAECGGFMYLHSVIEDRDGNPYNMVGAIDGVCRYTGHLVNFGYTLIESVKDDVPKEWREVLIGLRGHEFHYYESSAAGTDAILCKPSTGRSCPGMYITKNRLWGWPHLYYR